MSPTLKPSSNKSQEEKNPTNNSTYLVESKVDKDIFAGIFQQILKDISELNHGAGKDLDNELEQISAYNRRCLDYNVPHGKQIRGKLVVAIYKSLVPDATELQIQNSCILGWCVELLQAAFLVADDIMDNGETRRGKPCWYRLKEIGNTAVNDAFFLEHVAYQILRKYFGHLDCYTELLNLLLDITYKTVLGQGLDNLASNQKDLKRYNDDAYKAIITFKTGYYTVYLPVALAMIFAGLSKNLLENQETWEIVEHVALKLGEMFQIQDDYFDCFGDINTIGKKMGTDIEEGKCTWLFVKAKEILGNDENFGILKENYGRMEPENVKIVKALYAEIGLPNLFEDLQEKNFQVITTMIKKIGNESLIAAMSMFLTTIYKRKY